MAAVAALLGVVTWVQANRARTDLIVTTGVLATLRADLNLSLLEDRPDGLAFKLRGARAGIRSARARMSSWALAPVRPLPFIGPQIKGAITVLDRTGGMIDAALRAIETGRPLINGASPDRLLATLDGLIGVLDRLVADMEAQTLPSSGSLIGPVRSGRDEVERINTAVRDEARNARGFLVGMRSFLGGDGTRRYLLALGNNAEMRGSGGMYLSYGILEFTAGQFTLSSVGSTEDLQFQPGSVTVPVPPDYAAALGWLSPGRDIRNANATASFPQAAPIAADLVEARLGIRVDGVIAIDVYALGRLTGITGPIPVPSINATLDENLTNQILLSDVYRNYPNDAEARRRALGDAAVAVAGRLAAGGFKYGALAGRLSEVVRERHAMVWSRFEREQTVFASGTLGGGFPAARLPILAAVENTSANKLDYYVEIERQSISLDLNGRKIRGEISLTISNPTVVDRLPSYIVGPNLGLNVAAGTYVGLVAVWLPDEMTVTAVDGLGRRGYLGRQAGETLVTGIVVLAAREKVVVRIGFEGRLANEATGLPLSVLPQGRLKPSVVEIHARLSREWKGPATTRATLNEPVEAEWYLIAA